MTFAVERARALPENPTPTLRLVVHAAEEDESRGMIEMSAFKSLRLQIKMAPHNAPVTCSE